MSDHFGVKARLKLWVDRGVQGGWKCENYVEGN